MLLSFSATRFQSRGCRSPHYRHASCCDPWHGRSYLPELGTSNTMNCAGGVLPALLRRCGVEPCIAIVAIHHRGGWGINVGRPSSTYVRSYVDYGGRRKVPVNQRHYMSCRSTSYVASYVEDLPLGTSLLHYSLCDRPLYTCHPTRKTLLGTLPVFASAYASGCIALFSSVTSIVLVKFFDR